MKKIGIGIDYNNICKDYNTFYLDRDNTDPQTKNCMKKVMTWMQGLLTQLLQEFDYNIYYVSSAVPVKIEDVASKRFLFYSLEKEITLQSYVIAKEYQQYESLAAWESSEDDGLLLQNDEDGSCVYFCVREGSAEHQWLLTYLKDFSLDNVACDLK